MLLLLTLALAAPAPPQLAGTWTLDPNRSSDVRPMLARIGVPSFMASAAGAVTQVITLGADGITVVVHTSMKDSSETMSLVSGSETRGSLFGSDYVVHARVEGAAIVAEGTITLSGLPTPLTLKRTTDGTTMHSVAIIGVGAEATVLDRVFVRAQ